MAHLDLMLCVVDDRACSTIAHRCLWMQPACVRTPTDWIQMLGPNFERRRGSLDCTQVERRDHGDHRRICRCIDFSHGFGESDRGISLG